MSARVGGGGQVVCGLLVKRVDDEWAVMSTGDPGRCLRLMRRGEIQLALDL